MTESADCRDYTDEGNQEAGTVDRSSRPVASKTLAAFLLLLLLLPPISGLCNERNLRIIRDLKILSVSTAASFAVVFGPLS